MPYQERQTLEDEFQADSMEDPAAAPSRGGGRLAVIVILVALVAAGLATVFALMHS